MVLVGPPDPDLDAEAMISLLLPVLAPAWIPVYVVEQRVDAIDVWAASEAGATRVAPLWTTNGARPSMEFPFSGETDSRRIGADLYPDATRPYVRLSDRRTVGGCWYAATTPPAHDSAFRTPTLADWRATVAAHPEAAVEPGRHMGVQVSIDVRSVDMDAPDYRPTWSPYRRYVVTEAAHVWYYPAANAAEALRKARAEWIEGGVYAPGRRVRQAEAADLLRPPAPGDPPPLRALRAKLPARPWKALLATRCEPTRVRSVLPGSYETVRTSLPAQRPPYDDRVVGAGGVPFFSNGL